MCAFAHLLQESCLKNLKEQSRVKEVLLSYHPFWLRLGMEVVVHRAAAGEPGAASGQAFALHLVFFNRGREAPAP